MGRKAIISVIVVIILAGGGILLAANHKSGSNMGDMPMNLSTPSSLSNTATATNGVTIQNFAFSPANITIKVGTKVTWINQDSATHTVTETDGQAGPDSGSLPTGKSYGFTYVTAGTFKYHCSIHSDMLGTVTVTN